MKTTSQTYVNRRLHSQVKGKNSKLIVNGSFGRIELALVNKRYQVTAVNKETKQHFNKSFATLAGAMIAFDALRESWI